MNIGIPWQEIQEMDDDTIDMLLSINAALVEKRDEEMQNA